MTKLKPVDTTKPLNHSAHEEEILTYWDEVKAFERSVSEKGGNKSYVFYDGPPFATGLPHYGHLLASTAKDVVPRYWTMKGYKVERTWGWDCHGVPIENMIEGELGLKGGKKGIEEYGIANFNAACRASILRYDTEWKKTIKRLGRWVDMENSYKTMDTTFMESVWWAFAELYKKGLVYQGRKVILYCPRCSTPLSNFEIAMDNSYKEVESHSLTVKFKKKNSINEYFVAWTTTPWTLPGNVGLAVNPDQTYVQVKNGDELLWFAEARAPKELKVLKTVKGSELVGERYEPLFTYLPVGDQKSYVIIPADFVSMEDGTGIVHTAAIYGEDDYRVSVEEGLPTIPMLDDQGHFLDFVTDLKGQYYLKTQKWIIENLESRGLVYKSEMTTHSYPFCYRCGTALFYNALPAYFINIQKLKKDLSKVNQDINWYPAFLKNGRFGKGLETAPDWNISRSRYWGTPMPIWKGDQTGKVRIISSLSELKSWAVDPAQVESIQDIHREYVDDVKVWVDDAKTEAGTRIKDVFDCWIESGSMPFAAEHYPFENKTKFEARYPAQYIVEYIAQTRAWFYTLHVMSVALFGKPAFENAVTTGTILAEDGTKMSKSKKNYPDVNVLISKFGVDSLRLYLMSSVVMKADNLNFSESAVDDVRKNVMNIWWNIYVFYSAYCGSVELTMPQVIKNPLDQWLLSKVEGLTKVVTTAMDSYDVVGATRPLMAFAKDFSTWYVRLSRERLRNDKNSQAVFAYALSKYTHLMAPFAPFMAERIYQNMPHTKDSIHLEDWPTVEAKYQNPKLESDMMAVMDIVEGAHALRKNANLRLRQPLSRLTVASKLGGDLLKVIADELNVKEVVVGSELSLDTNLTPELEDEGKARDLMRDIQGERKKQGLKPTDQVVVITPSYPTSWESEIKAKVGAKSLSQGEVFSVTKA
ncbi:MAG: isoleucine--tRNA ligase [bacterium]|nr:isoleucine--tRNA ligase [bacterium]RIK51586.1 MAG: isoleucine--tRNA ligase [Candidatus Microgenomates bacterium]